MSNCTKCGGSLGDPFDFSSTTVSACQCNLGGLVTSSAALPSDPCCVVSVADKTGEVRLDINDIDLLGNTFYTTTGMRADLSAVDPIMYDAGTGTFSHNISGVTAGTYGDAVTIPVLTVDPDGHITNISTASVTLVTLGAELEAIKALGGTGILVRTGTGTWAFRSITSVAGRIVVTYPDGVSGNPLVDLDVSGVTAGTYGSNGVTYPIITVDDYGRITSAAVGTIPTPTLPDHTHTLGQLSNVADAVDSAPTVGDLLYYNGSEWTYTSASAVVTFTDGIVSASGTWNFCTSPNVVDTESLESQINIIRKLTGSGATEPNVITINAALYNTWATITGAASTIGTYRYSTVQIGTIETAFCPIHDTVIPCPGMLLGSSYSKFDDTTTIFSDVQLTTDMSVLIKANGEVYVNVYYSGTGTDIDQVRLSGVDQIIVHFTTSYPSKTIV